MDMGTIITIIVNAFIVAGILGAIAYAVDKGCSRRSSWLLYASHRPSNVEIESEPMILPYTKPVSHYDSMSGHEFE